MKLINFLLGTFTILLFIACEKPSSEDSLNVVTKNVSGQLDKSYQITTLNKSSNRDEKEKKLSAFQSQQMRSQITSLNSVNEIWAMPITKTDYYTGASNVTFNKTNIIEGKQVFKIENDGSFNIDIINPCLDESGRGCLGMVLVLADSTESDQTKQIKSFVSLDGVNTLVNLPYQEMADTVDIGVLEERSSEKNETVNEAVGIAFQDENVSFSSLSTSELKEISQCDDILKVVRNIYANPGYDVQIRHKYRIANVLFDSYSDISAPVYLGTGFSIYSYDSNLTFIADGTTTYSLYPPSSVHMLIRDHQTALIDSSEEFNQTKPLMLTSSNDPLWGHLYEHDIQIADIYFSNGYYIETIPEGEWVLKENNVTIGSYDLGLTNPFDVTGVQKNFVPSLNFQLNSDGYIYKLSLKWYLYDGKKYNEVIDLTNLSRRISRSTLEIGHDIYSLPSDAKDFILTTPIDPATLNLHIMDCKYQYGFYGSEIEIAYIFN